MFDKQTKARKLIAHVCTRVSHTPNTHIITHLYTGVSHNSNTDKILYIPARMNHGPIPAIRKTDRRPKKITHMLSRK